MLLFDSFAFLIYPKTINRFNKSTKEETINILNVLRTNYMSTIDLGIYYVILPSVAYNHSNEEYLAHYNASFVPEGFHYSSDKNTQWETVETLREKIKKYVDPNFEVK